MGKRSCLRKTITIVITDVLEVFIGKHSQGSERVMRLTVVLAHHLIFMGASPAKVRLRKVMFVTTPWHPEQSGMLPIEAPWPSWNTTFSMRTLAVSFLMQTGPARDGG